MKQTAVEWFWNEIAEVLPFTVDSTTAIKMYDKLQQAKAMEKKQIIDARITSPPTTGDVMLDTEEAEQYYNETYNEDK